jgi:hypothetical protein
MLGRRKNNDTYTSKILVDIDGEVLDEVSKNLFVRLRRKRLLVAFADCHGVGENWEQLGVRQ